LVDGQSIFSIEIEDFSLEIAKREIAKILEFYLTKYNKEDFKNILSLIDNSIFTFFSLYLKGINIVYKNLKTNEEKEKFLEENLEKIEETFYFYIDDEIDNS
jgi:RNA binding exosome subunit